MTAQPKILGAAVLAFFLGAVWIVSPGFFNIDEFIYYAGAQAVADGGWAVANGDGDLESRQLNLWLLVNGPNGLVPQYPVGTAIFGGALLAVFGLPGLLLLNALASAGVIFATYAIAMRHFGRKNVAFGAVALLLGASFFLEYAFAVWPHAVAMLAILLAVLWMLDSFKTDQLERGKMLTIGIALGVGLSFRSDVAIGIVGIGLCLFLWSSRPVARLVFVGLGLLPFLAVLAAANFYKFGEFNPVSYGQTNGGGTSLASHGILLVGLICAGLLALAARWFWTRGTHRKPLLVLGSLAILAALIVAHDFALAYFQGFWALVVDATTIADRRTGIDPMPSGTLSFWGYWKKALGQSMPWLGLLLAACFGVRRVETRSLQAFAVLFLVWGLPFFPRDWHGGMGSNMRYFLPLIPLACALAASLLADLWAKTPQAPRIFAFSLVGGMLAPVAWALLHNSGAGGAQQILPTLVLLPTAAIALIAGYLCFENKPANVALMVLSGVGVGLAGQLALTDFRMAQEGRANAVAYSEAHAELPRNALAFVPSRFLVGWALQEGQVAALPNDFNGKFDTKLIDAALAKGYRIFIWPRYLTDQLEDDERYMLAPSGIGLESSELIELKAQGAER